MNIISYKASSILEDLVSNVRIWYGDTSLALSGITGEDSVYDINHVVI